MMMLMSGLLMWACSGNEDKTFAPEPVVRLDLMMQSLTTADSAAVADSLSIAGPEIDAMFKVLGISELTVADIMEWSRGEAVKVFQPAVDTVFSSTLAIETIVGGIVGRAAREQLGVPPMRYATVTWGSMRPMVRVDSVMLIALNHYLGADYPGYAGFEAYRRSEKTPESMPYDLAASLAATQYPMDMAETPTLLNWMLYEGALVETRMRLVPDASLAKALGVGNEQLKMLQDNTKEIWKEMAVRRLIYDTDPLTIDRYLGAAPSTPLLQGRTPGRAARYIGYCIVKAWLSRHPDTSLRELLQPSFYAGPATLAESGFSGDI